MTWVAVGTTVASVGTGLLSKQKAPKSIPTTPLDIAKASKDAMDINKGVFNDAAGLSEKTNTFNQSEANRLSELAMPGFSKLQATLAAKIQSDFDNEGQLAPDQISQLERLAGERGITNGASGGIRGLSLVKDFGFSMMDAKNADRVRAIQGLQSLMGMSARVSPTSPMHAFVNTNQTIAAQQQNNSDAQAAAQSNANAQAAASNANASMWGNVFGTVAGVGLDAWKNRVPNKVSNPPPGQFDYDNYN